MRVRIKREGAKPSCLEAANADDNDVVNLTDAVAILNHLFKGTGPLPEPFNNCGIDTTSPEKLGCEKYPTQFCMNP